MQRIGPRIYLVRSSDFPIHLRVEAKDIANFAAVVGDVLVMQRAPKPPIRFAASLAPPDGQPLVGEFALPHPDDPATPPAERYQPPSSVNLLILASFATASGVRPRYEITITAADGDQAVTTMGKPSVGESRAPITFQYR